MFRTRLITTLVLVPLVLLAIFYTQPWVLGGLVAGLVLIGSWEWAGLIPLKSIYERVAFLIIQFAMIFVAYYLFQLWLVLGLLAWIGILLCVLYFPASQYYWGRRLIVAALSLLLLPLFVSCFARIYFLPDGQPLILYLLCLVWAADIGGYLFGRAIGKTKLIPKVSPGKTIEGVFGGIVLALLVSVVGYFWFTAHHSWLWFFAAIITAVVSVLGDLFISILKRRCHLKDTGHIFPGHGGVLDRIDSLIAATPVFYFWLVLISNGY